MKTPNRLMIELCAAIALLAPPLWAVAQSPVGPPPAGPAPSADQAGYAYGVNFGQQLYRLGITNEIPLDSFERGFKDGLAGKTTTPADIQTVMQYVTALNTGIYVRNESAAKKFLEDKAAEKGVKKTASGLEYKIIAPGNKKAASPKPTDAVVVQYTGKLIDGTQFDASNGSTTLALAGVIKGWQEALPMMAPGAKWQIFVPPDLAYGTQVKPGIPTGSALIFDVELVGVAPTPGASSGG